MAFLLLHNYTDFINLKQLKNVKVIISLKEVKKLIIEKVKRVVYGALAC